MSGEIDRLAYCIRLHRAGEAMSGFRVVNVDVPVGDLEVVLAIAAGSREGHDSEAWRGAKQARAGRQASPNPCDPSPNSSQDRV